LAVLIAIFAHSLTFPLRSLSLSWLHILFNNQNATATAFYIVLRLRPLWMVNCAQFRVKFYTSLTTSIGDVSD